MKRLRIVWILSVAMTVLTGLAFVNNLVAIVNWWRAFRTAGGDSSLLAAQTPGLVGWLDWSAVDYSGVTTFIPFLGMLCLTRAAGRLLRGRSVPSEDFPFFRGSDQFNIALGLFGTLWGIIVIGYFKLESVRMADLMQCLHTALFSTLAAVVWVFLLDRPLIRPFFVRLLEASGLAAVDDGDLAGAVDRLTARLLAAGEAVDARQKKSEETFARRLSETESALARLTSETVDRCERHLADYERQFEARQKEYVETFRREIAAQSRRAETAEAKLKAVLAALQG